MGRIPPHSIDAERSVLGAAMLSEDSLGDVVGILKAKDFYEPQHQLIFQTMLDLYEKSEPVDLMTVATDLGTKKVLDKVGGRTYLSMLTTEVPVIGNARAYAKTIVEKADMRRLAYVADSIKDLSYEETKPSDEILDLAESEIFKIAMEKQHTPYSQIKDVIPESIKKINHAANQSGGITGLSTGFVDLDQKTSGLQKSDLIIVAARPAMGKTAFALSLALNAATKAGSTVMVFSLEMSKVQITDRMLSMKSLVEMEKIKKGTMDTEDWGYIYAAMEEFYNTNLFIDDTADIKMREIKSKCRRLKAEKGLDLVIIDYLQLMTGEGRAESRQQEVSALSRNLKLLARELDCPVIALSQLSRGLEARQDKRPMLSDLRESGAIEQDADIVMFLYRDEYYNPESDKQGIAELIIAKHRSGETGTIELSFVGKNTSFRTLERKVVADF